MKLGILIGILILIDQVIKISILAINPQWISESGWGIELSQGIKSEDNVTYIILSLIAVILILRYIASKNPYIKNDSKIVLSFAVAGAISNIIDRIWKGYAINYIQIPNFTPINLSYVYIIVTWLGMAVILTKYTIKKISKKNKGCDNLAKKEKGKNNEKGNNSKKRRK